MFLLQTFQLKEQDPVSMMVAAGVFVGFILFLVIANKASGGSTSSGSGSKRKKFSKGAFRRKARSLGLGRYQIGTLENLIKRYPVRNPFALLSNLGQLDSLFKKAIVSIEGQGASEQVRESQKLTLFRIRQKIEQNYQKKTLFTGTKQIRIGQAFVLTPESGGRYQSKIVSNLKDALGVQIPVNNVGQQVRWKKWSRVMVFFWRPNGQGYTFHSKVAGYSELKGVSSLLLSHTNQIIQAKQRKYRRKNMEKPAFFYPVKILTQGLGKNVQKRAFVETNRYTLATMLDISGGGCSIKTSYPLGQGELIKVEFESGKRNAISFFGKVKHMRRIKPYGGIMHIMFTRISKKYLNKINSYVYNYSEE